MNTIEPKALLNLIDRAVAELKYPDRTPGLVRPISYTLAGGGKRLRPMLVLATCRAVGTDPESAIDQALAIEMFHNFTLIHDDVMDNAAKRRGRPTVYNRWGAVQAILSGDTLLNMAVERLSRCPADKLHAVLDLFNRTAIEVYEGQQLDIEFEHRDNVSVKRYLEMISLKTSVLLGCACRMGALMGGANEAVQQAMYGYGLNLGLAFQLRDDWLDTYGDPAVFGKSIGGDILNRKKTWLYINARKGCPAEIDAAYAGNSGKARLIAKVRGIYDKLNLSAKCDELIHGYCDAAIAALDRAALDPEAREWFVSLATSLSHRDK